MADADRPSTFPGVLPISHHLSPSQPLTSLLPADGYHLPCPQVQGLRAVEKFLSRPSPALFTGSPELAAQQLPRGQVRGPGLSPALLTTVPLLARNNTVCTKMGQNNKGLQEAKCSKKKMESKNLGKPKKLKSKVRVPEKKKVQQPSAAVPEGEQVEPEVPKTSRGHGLITCPGAWGRQLPTGDPGVIFLKPGGDMQQLEVADQWNWFEGLPRRIHLPGPRVMCRPSTMRLVKRCCTRFCSASLELPMCHPYRV